MRKWYWVLRVNPVTVCTVAAAPGVPPDTALVQEEEAQCWISKLAMFAALLGAVQVNFTPASVFVSGAAAANPATVANGLGDVDWPGNVKGAVVCVRSFDGVRAPGASLAGPKSDLADVADHMRLSGQGHGNLQIAPSRKGVDGDAGVGQRDMPDDGIRTVINNHGDGRAGEHSPVTQSGGRNPLPGDAELAPLQAARRLQILRTRHPLGQGTSPVAREEGMAVCQYPPPFIT